MQSLREYITESEKQHRAIGHFNVATVDMIWAVLDGARRASEKAGTALPVIIGVSEGERSFLGVRQVAQMIKSIRDEFTYPVFLNADHTYSVEGVYEVIDAGFDMAIYDGADRSAEENYRNTSACVAYRDSHRAHTLIEAEFGFIGAGSNIKDAVPEGVSEETMTKSEEAREFVQQTNVDLLAPSVGNVHGVVKTGNPALHPERISEIREQAGVPLVLHGGSGSSDEDFAAAVAAGISVVHVSTDLRIAYRNALMQSLQETEELAPYKYLKPARERVADVVERYILLFSNVT